MRWRTPWNHRALAAASLLLSLGVVAVALGPLLEFLRVALVRLRYPFELEWMEGGIVTHIQVVRAGESLYREPSFDFTPFIYAPLYYYVCALSSFVTGVGYFTPRLVSLLSILGCFALIGYWVRRETGSFVAGVAAIGVFSATYAQSGMWFDIARVDSMYLLAILGGYLLCRYGESNRVAAAAGVILAASFFAKQGGLPISIPALAYLALKSPRRGLVAAATFAGVVLGGVLLFQVTSKGWFYYYVFGVPSRHEMLWGGAKKALLDYFWNPVAPLALGGAAVTFGLAAQRTRGAEWLLHAGFVLSTCVMSFLSILHTGGYPNVLIPAYASLSVASGLAIGELLRRAPAGSARGAGARAFAVLVVFAQCTLLAYDPKVALPTLREESAMRRVLRDISALPRPLWITASSYYGVLAGQPDIVSHTMAPVDVFKAPGPEADRLHDEIVAVIRSHRFRTIVLDRAAGFLPPDIIAEIHQAYRPEGRLFRATEGNLWPKGGAQIRPDEIWLAK